jgi:hypothetical protein
VKLLLRLLQRCSVRRTPTGVHPEGRVGAKGPDSAPGLGTIPTGRNVLKLGSPAEDTDALVTVMMRLRIPPRRATGTGMNPLWASVSKWIDEDHARMIEVADVLMDIRMTDYLRLDQLLSEGASLYTSAENRIEERVDRLAKQALVAATHHASEDLSEAWNKAYGRHQDASDAWDHEIKAVEAVLIDAVVQKQTNPTRGHVLGHLQRQGHLFRLLIPGPNSDYSVAPLISMLELM